VSGCERGRVWSCLVVGGWVFLVVFSGVRVRVRVGLVGGVMEVGATFLCLAGRLPSLPGGRSAVSQCKILYGRGRACESGEWADCVVSRHGA
jgi:hypothetical protein